MKKINQLIIAIAVIFSASYLAWSFIHADFDIRNWGTLSRIFYIVFNGFFSGLFLISIYSEK